MNCGCIPTKALLKSAELYSSLSSLEEFGALASELRGWKWNVRSHPVWAVFARTRPMGKCSPDAPMFPNTDGGFINATNYRNRVLKPLTDSLGIPKLNFQVIRRTIATRALGLGLVILVFEKGRGWLFTPLQIEAVLPGAT